MKLSKIAVTGMLAVGILVSSQLNPYAAEVGSVKTKGDVTFKQDDRKVNPLDPENPDGENPIVPLDPEKIEGTPGPLSIDYISHFHFGEQLISAKDETYYAKLDKVQLADGSEVERPNFLQVTDKRGTNAGWKLQVQQGAQFSTDVAGKAKELRGATIKITDPIVKTTADNKAGAPKANPSITLVPEGAAQDVLTAQQDQGMASWIETFGGNGTEAKSVSLSVPGTSEKVKDATYTTELTWTLSDTPA